MKLCVLGAEKVGLVDRGYFEYSHGSGLKSWWAREEALGISVVQIWRPLRPLRIGTFMWCLMESPYLSLRGCVCPRLRQLLSKGHRILHTVWKQLWSQRKYKSDLALFLGLYTFFDNGKISWSQSLGHVSLQYVKWFLFPWGGTTDKYFYFNSSTFILTYLMEKYIASIQIYDYTNIII